jgi:hypothetical protein
VVGEEPPGVGEDGPPLLHGGDDGGELVVQKHQVGGLSGHVRPGPAHGHPDVRLVEGGPVVHPVPGHGHHVAPSPEGPGDPQLVLRLHPTDDDAVVNLHHVPVVENGVPVGVLARHDLLGFLARRP